MTDPLHRQLGLQDDSPAQLTGQMQSLPRTMGAEGSQALGDIKQYVGSPRRCGRPPLSP